jgi:biotin carboxylase
MNVVVSIGLRKNPLEHRPALEAAHRLGCSTVLVASKPPAGLPEGLVAGVRTVDPHDPDAFDETVDAIADEHTPVAVVAWTDSGVEPAARAAARLGLPGVSPAAARLARNKYLMRTALTRSASHLMPRFARVRTWSEAMRAAEEVGFPAVLKPAAGSGSKGIYQLPDGARLREAFDELTRLTGPDGDGIFRHDPHDLVFEELVTGSEHSVEGFVLGGEVIIAGITDKTTTEPFRLELAHLHPSALPAPARAAIHDLTRETVTALGFDDCTFHLECMYDPASGPRLIEVAARAGGDFIGSHLVSLSTGVSFHENVLRVAMGHRPELPDKRPLYAGIHKVMAARSGTLADIDGLDAALATPGVQHVAILRARGTAVRLPPASFSSSVIGAVIATGGTPASVRATSEAAARSITVAVAPSADPVTVLRTSAD